MTDQSGARRIAQEWLRRQFHAEEEVVLDEEQTLEEPFGWEFFYNAREFLETGDFRSQLLGNAPIVVERSTSEVYETGTAKPLEEYLRPYRN